MQTLTFIVLILALSAPCFTTPVDILTFSSGVADDGDVSVASGDPSQRIGRKDRCRHVVRQELRKYLSKIREMSETVRQLRRSIVDLQRSHSTRDRKIDILQQNVTEQNILLISVMTELNMLKTEHMLRAGRIGESSEENEKKIQPTGQEKTTTMVTPDIHPHPRDCDEVYRNGGLRYSDSYAIMLQPTGMEEPFKVLCQKSHDAGWIIIQNRHDGSVDFDRTWTEYKTGFGNVMNGDEFWLGNDKIHNLTRQSNYTLRIELEEFKGNKHWAEYSRFYIADEGDKYRLKISGYQGNGGDSLSRNNDSPFTTKDEDNDIMFGNCADTYLGGWWYEYGCKYSNLNSIYMKAGMTNDIFLVNGMIWHTVDEISALKSARMMIKPTLDY